MANRPNSNIRKAGRMSEDSLQAPSSSMPVDKPALSDDMPSAAEENQTIKPTRMDAWTGLIFVVFGAAVTFESWRMPRMDQFGSSKWSAPGVVPGMIGVALVIMGAILFFRAFSALWTPSGGSKWEQGAIHRVLSTLVLCIGFAAFAVGWLPFKFAAFLFLFVFIAVFDWQDRKVAGIHEGGRPFLMRLLLALAVAAIAAYAIGTIFEDVFFVRLP